jgi:hypothetical protein
MPLSTSIAVDGYGRPVVAFLEASSRPLTVVRCGNASCTAGNTVASVDSPGSGASGFQALTIGTDGKPIVAYRDGSSALRVVHCGNIDCLPESANTITTVDSSAQVGDFVAITIGANGFPVMSYRDATAQALKVAHCGSVDCSPASGNTVTTLDDDSGNLAQGTAIAVGADGSPVVAYYDLTAGALKFAYCGNAKCSPASANVGFQKH